MAVGVVAMGTSHQPKHVLYTQILLQRLIDFLTAQSGVAHLHLGIEIAFLRRQHRATAVHFNTAAF